MNWHCKFRSILLPFFGEFSPKGVWALFNTISLFIPFLFITSKPLPCPPSFLSVQSQRDSYCWCFLQRVSTSIKFYSPKQYRISSDQGVLSHDCDRKRWTSTPNRLKKQVNAIEVFLFLPQNFFPDFADAAPPLWTENGYSCHGYLRSIVYGRGPPGMSASKVLFFWIWILSTNWHLSSHRPSLKVCQSWKPLT